MSDDFASRAHALASEAKTGLEIHTAECALRWKSVDDRLATALEQRREQAIRLEAGFREIRVIVVKVGLALIGGLAMAIFTLLLRGKGVL